MSLSSASGKVLLSAAVMTVIAALSSVSIPSTKAYAVSVMAEYDDACNKYSRGSRRWKRCMRRNGLG